MRETTLHVRLAEAFGRSKRCRRLACLPARARSEGRREKESRAARARSEHGKGKAKAKRPTRQHMHEELHRG